MTQQELNQLSIVGKENIRLKSQIEIQAAEIDKLVGKLNELSQAKTRLELENARMERGLARLEENALKIEHIRQILS